MTELIAHQIEHSRQKEALVFLQEKRRIYVVSVFKWFGKRVKNFLTRQEYLFKKPVENLIQMFI